MDGPGDHTTQRANDADASQGSRVRGVTANESWRQWCEALRLLNCSDAEVASLFGKRSAADQAELNRRMDVIRRTRAIPVGEFLQ